MDDTRPTIIIRRRKHVAEHHGGAWKVAMADFMSTMFALFLTLWILGQSQEVKRAVAYYFRHPMDIPHNISPLPGGSGILQSTPTLPGDAKNTGGKMNEPTDLLATKPRVTSPDPAERPVAPVTPDEIISNQEWIEFKRMVDKLWKEMGVDPEFERFKDNLRIQAFENGVLIQIVDQEHSPLFVEGSRSFSAPVKRVFKLLASQISRFPNNPVEIDGHEAAPELDRKLHWTLSAQMADDARVELEDNGVKYPQITKVGACSDTRLLDKAKPEDPCNRRVSILLRPQNWVPDSY
jgi:chemotaxis protein MotB